MKNIILKPLRCLVIMAVVLSLTLGMAAASLADWNPGDCCKMHFPQLPDLVTGMDVWSNDGSVVADDFECTESGNITDIHIWASYLDDYKCDYSRFEICIYDDAPAGEGGIPYSRPGALLWNSYFGSGDYSELPYAEGVTEDFYDPLISAIVGTDNICYQYNFYIDPVDAFEQVEGEIYWLSVELTNWEDCPGEGYPAFGWKTSLDNFQDPAVYLDTIEPFSEWEPLSPAVDMAFVITTDTDYGSIILEKQTDPDGSSQSFTIRDPAGAPVTSLTDGETYEMNCLIPGTYTFIEDIPGCWDLTGIVISESVELNSDADLNTGTVELVLDPGEEIHVTFQDTEYGIITVVKETDPPGSPQEFEITGTVPGLPDVISEGTPWESGCIRWGQYSVTETVPQCWELTGIDTDDNNGSIDLPTATATINLDPGEDVTVTFQDTEYGTITVVKETDPPGSPEEFEITGTAVTGLISDLGPPLESGCIRWGVYTVEETIPDCWELTGVGVVGASDYHVADALVEIDLQPGEDVVITYEDMQWGWITVEKQTDPEGAGMIFDFAGDRNGTLVDDGQLTGPCLPPYAQYWSQEMDTYLWELMDIMITGETHPTGLQSTYDLTERKVFFNLDPGEDIKATFTNKYFPPPEGPPAEGHGAPVGIEVFSVNKPALLAPWIALAAVIIVGGVLLLRRYRAHR